VVTFRRGSPPRPGIPPTSGGDPRGYDPQALLGDGDRSDWRRWGPKSLPHSSSFRLEAVFGAGRSTHTRRIDRGRFRTRVHVRAQRLARGRSPRETRRSKPLERRPVVPPRDERRQDACYIEQALDSGSGILRNACCLRCLAPIETRAQERGSSAPDWKRSGPTRRRDESGSGRVHETDESAQSGIAGQCGLTVAGIPSELS
jgi:hypothetical protein